MHFEDPTSNSELKVSVNSTLLLTLNNNESLQKLFTFVTLLNKEAEEFKQDYYSIQSLTVNYAAVTGNETIQLNGELEFVGYHFIDGMDLIKCEEVVLTELECKGYSITIGGKDKSDEKLNHLEELVRKQGIPVTKMTIPDKEEIISIVLN
ncbi:hypothetical protein FZW96_08700 [Bacillus sp. BGMRC 2118]|nr:hypothetical protein FZW96_08700 [Bacillus sp. BGMRC 2118]